MQRGHRWTRPGSPPGPSRNAGQEGGTLGAEGHSQYQAGARGLEVSRKSSQLEEKKQSKAAITTTLEQGTEEQSLLLSEPEGPDMRPCSVEAGFPQVPDVF